MKKTFGVLILGLLFTNLATASEASCRAALTPLTLILDGSIESYYQSFEFTTTAFHNQEHYALQWELSRRVEKLTENNDQWRDPSQIIFHKRTFEFPENLLNKKVLLVYQRPMGISIELIYGLIREINPKYPFSAQIDVGEGNIVTLNLSDTALIRAKDESPTQFSGTNDAENKFNFLKKRTFLNAAELNAQKYQATEEAIRIAQELKWGPAGHEVLDYQIYNFADAKRLEGGNLLGVYIDSESYSIVLFKGKVAYINVDGQKVWATVVVGASGEQIHINLKRAYPLFSDRGFNQ
jgi:hypothetical protein